MAPHHDPTDAKDMTGSTSNRGLTRRAFLGAGVGIGLTAAAAGCTGGSEEKQTVTGKGVEGVKKVALAPEVPGINYPDPYVGPRARRNKPFGDGKTTFTVVVPEDPIVVGDWNDNKFSAWLEERTGVKIKYQAVPADDAVTKVNAMISSGDLPDAFMSIGLSMDQISLYGSQGILLALDDYIETYAPQLKQAFTDYPDLKRILTSPDKLTYAIPNLNDCWQCTVGQDRAWINREFIDKVGGKIPETTEEFRELLKTFKDDDANGHGDTVPLVAGEDSPLDAFFMNSFLYNPGEPWLRLDEGKVDFVANKDGWREGLKYLRSLYDDGTLTRDAFTMTEEQVKRLGDSPGHARVGVARTFWYGSFMTIELSPDARWHDYAAIPALQGPDGTRYTGWNYYVGRSAGLVITKECSDPGMLVRWADAQMELEAMMRSLWGIKNDRWVWAPKGDKGTEGTQAVWKLLYGGSEGSVPNGTGWAQLGVQYRSHDYRATQATDPNNPSYAAELDHATSDAYEPYKQPKEWQLPPLIFDQAAAADNADIAATLANHVPQSLAKFTIGQLDIHDDDDWNDYVDKIDAIGLPRYLENYQKAYETSAWS